MKFKCKICGKKCANGTGLAAHQRAAHSKTKPKSTPKPKAKAKRNKRGRRGKGRVAKRGTTPNLLPASTPRSGVDAGMLGKLADLRDEFRSKANTLQEMIDQLKKL